MKFCSWFLGLFNCIALLVAPSFGQSQDLEWRIHKNEAAIDFRLSNNQAFWSLTHKVEEFLRPYLRYEGWVLGDPHPANFGALYTSASWVFAPNDFDDGGEGPLVLDLLRYLSTTHDQSSTMLAELVDSYRDGLCGVAPLLPDFMDSTGRTSLELNQSKDIDPEGFIAESRELFPVPRIQREKFLAHLPSGRLIDAYATYRDKGGSSGLKRFWFLIEDQYSQMIHFEFKIMAQPATAMYQNQKSHSIRIESLKKVYWPASLGDSIKVVEVDGISYLLRIRRSDPLHVHANNSPGLGHLKNLYWVAQMGFAHGKQELGKNLCAVIQASPQDFTDRVLRARAEINREFDREFGKKVLESEPIQFYGGFRYRIKTVEQEMAERRSQHKLRVQLGAELRFRNFLSSTIAISTGDSSVSRNSDLGEGFLSKDTSLYLAALRWKKSDRLTWQIGKMKIPFRQLGDSELVWDSDITPEGLALQYGHTVGKFPIFANFGGFILSENYKSKKLKDEPDNSILAAQFGTGYSWRKWNLTVAGGAIHYTGVKGVAFADLTNGETGGNSSTQDDRFLYDYFLNEAMFELSYISTIDIGLFGHLVHNAAIGERNRAYRIGLVLENGPWEGGYSYREVEKDSLFGYFTESSFGDGETDLGGSELSFAYRIQKGLKFKLSHQWVARIQRSHIDFTLRF